MHSRRKLLLAIIAAGLMQPSMAYADGRERLLQLLSGAHPAQCTEQAAKIGTIKRLEQTNFPTKGRLIVVNLASQQLTAYQDGEVAMEMRVVVGAPDKRTPDMQTEVSFVRFNPTWVVPSSIIHDEEWQQRLRDPQFIIDYGFTAYDASGKRVSSSREHPIARLVQSASDDNALGLIKFGLRAGNSIYLHDTTAKSGFNNTIRATSHGCVRVQKPFELAAWMLGTSTGDAHRMQARGDRENRVPTQPVHVILGYFTAWPSADGTLKYYKDVYHRDGTCAGGEQEQDIQSSGEDYQMEYNSDSGE